MLISMAFHQRFDPSETEYHKAPSNPQHCSTFFSTTSQHPPLKKPKSYPTPTTSQSHPRSAQHYLIALQTWLTSAGYESHLKMITAPFSHRRRDSKRSAIKFLYLHTFEAHGTRVEVFSLPNAF